MLHGNNVIQVMEPEEAAVSPAMEGLEGKG